MIFFILKYLQPTHYFQLCNNSGKSVFPITKELPKAILDQLEEDDTYSEIAQEYDLSWQAIQKGYIGEASTYIDFSKVTLKDNYYFGRKYFNAFWVAYVLIIRLISLNNPIKEIGAWYATRHIKRSDYLKTPIQYPDWKTFDSELVKSNPKVSVIIPTLNRYDYLKDILKNFETQDYKNFEVIVVDQSEPFQEHFYKDFNLEINLIHQKEKALWLARNNAIRAAKGELIALSEDDVLIEDDWISSHLKCLDFFQADISAGVFYPMGHKIPQERSYFKIASQFATGNAMLYKNVFKEVGLFDRQFEKQRMGDGEFGLRTFLNGFKSVSNPVASCVDVKAGEGGLREMGSWDAFRSTKIFAARPIPSVLYFFRRYFGNSRVRWSLFRTVPLSIMPYKFKKNKPFLVLGIFVSIILLPLVAFQVSKSWYLSSKKITQGPLIKQLD